MHVLNLILPIFVQLAGISGAFVGEGRSPKNIPQVLLLQFFYSKLPVLLLFVIGENLVLFLNILCSTLSKLTTAGVDQVQLQCNT